MALNIAQDPELFKEAMDSLVKDVNAASNSGTREQKIATWSQVARARGFTDPFLLSPQLISEVAACLKAAGYRSVPAYLSLAKQEFARKHLQGSALPDGILLAIREASRSARRGLGPSKHTGELPFLRLSELESFAFDPRPEEPAQPLATMVMACWFLMREIEVADLQIRHVSFRCEAGTLYVDVYLRVQKTDPQGSGCTRTHTCTCSTLPACLCPYHVGKAQQEIASTANGGRTDAPFFPAANNNMFTKKGFVSMVQVICKALGVPTHAPNGASLVTGHVPRATGAIFFAENGVEVWRIQLLGRWGSGAIKLYIKDAPVKAMSKIVLEALANQDLHEVSADLASLEGALDRASKPGSLLPRPSLAELKEAGLTVAGPRLPSDGDDLVLNLKAKPAPKLHAVNIHQTDRTICGWRFGLVHPQTIKRVTSADDGNLCVDCFRLRQRRTSEPSPESSASSGSSSED